MKLLVSAWGTASQHSRHARRARAVFDILHISRSFPVFVLHEPVLLAACVGSRLVGVVAGTIRIAMARSRAVLAPLATASWQLALRSLCWFAAQCKGGHGLCGGALQQLQLRGSATGRRGA